MEKTKRTILSRFDGSKFHAGPKAKRDIETILSADYGFTPVFFDVGTSKIAKLIHAVGRIGDVWRESRQADLLVVQWPYSDKQIYTRAIAAPITWIHDVDYIRLQKPSLKDFELDFLKRSRILIVHNEVMAQALIKEGVDSARIVVLELFDYLAEGPVPTHHHLHPVPELTYTGNLDKSEFLWQLRPGDMRYELHVYGSLDQDIRNPKIHYQDTLPPDTVPNAVTGDIGLVWDGNADDSDAGAPNKNYTRYNNPHKLSCYIAAGMPVIVWRQSAISRLVSRYDIGWVIDTLEDINTLDFSSYEQKRRHVLDLAGKVRAGYFSRRAMDAALKKLGRPELIPERGPQAEEPQASSALPVSEPAAPGNSPQDLNEWQSQQQ